MKTLNVFAYLSSPANTSESKKEKKRKRSRSRSKSGDTSGKKSKSSKSKRKRSDDLNDENGVSKSGGQASDDEGEVKDDPFSPKKQNGVADDLKKTVAKKEPLSLEELLAKKKAEEAAVTKVGFISTEINIISCIR